MSLLNTPLIRAERNVCNHVKLDDFEFHYTLETQTIFIKGFAKVRQPFDRTFDGLWFCTVREKKKKKITVLLGF